MKPMVSRDQPVHETCWRGIRRSAMTMIVARSRHSVLTLIGMVLLTATSCFDRPARAIDSSGVASDPPSAAPSGAASPPASAAAPPARPPSDGSEPLPAPPEHPAGVPEALPSLRWLAHQQLRPHVSCDPECGELPLEAHHPAPAALWTEDLESAPQRFERDARVDVYGLVLRGTAIVHDHAYGTDYELSPWQAFHAPGAGISLTAGRPVPRLLLALVTDGRSVRKVARQRARPWALRNGKIDIVDMREVADRAWAGGQIHARTAFASGRASFGILATGARAPMPPHGHQKAWEIIGLLAADGELRLGASAQTLGPSAGARSESRRLVDGDVVAVPPRKHHTWMPSGDKVLFAVQLYAPPGPEQRFEKLSERR